jgi:hypothetical protein
MSILPNRPAPEEFSDVIAIIDAEDFWEELLLPALSLARRESARLRVLVLPSASSTERLDVVRAELQGHDIRTLPLGVQCTPAENPFEQTLMVMLEETPRPLLLLRKTATRSTSDAVSTAVLNLLSPAPVAAHEGSPRTDSNLLCFVKRA